MSASSSPESGDDERVPELEFRSIEPDNLTDGGPFNPSANKPVGMRERWVLEDRDRQFGDRFERVTIGKLREVPFADWFEVGVECRLLGKVFERIWISNSETAADFDVLAEDNPFRMDADTVLSGNGLAVDVVE